jgi:hypothetical protein
MKRRKGKGKKRERRTEKSWAGKDIFCIISNSAP